MSLRIKIVSYAFILLFSLVVVRLFYVQVVKGKEYSAKGLGQYVAGRQESQKRGNIFFTRRDGVLVSAATMHSGYTLAISPKNISDIDKTFSLINAVTPVDKDEFYTKANKKNDPYEEVAYKIDKAKSDKIKELKIPGVFSVKSSWRSYPGNERASQALGLVAYMGEYEEGVYGLEKQYEEYLAPAHAQVRVNPFAAVFRNLGNKKESDLEYDVITTIEPEIQAMLEKTMKNIKQTYNSEGVGGIVMNPKTGEILAMAYAPDFNPNKISEVKDESLFRNPSVSGVYEFGSVIKPLIAAAGFDAGVITPETTYMDTGSIKVGVETIHNFDGKGRGLVNIKTILGQSLNTGMVMISQRLGQKNMRDYFEKYGLRKTTGIDLPNEGDSLTRNLDSRREIEFAAASFGQGFAVTPVQVVRAFSALANDGVPSNPFLVKEIRTQGGHVVKKIEPSHLPPAISKDAANTISLVLTHVVDTDLKNGNLAFPHHSVAAKTGTAQIAKQTGGYYEDRSLHSMFAYIPASNPEYLVFIYNIYPKNVDYASNSLAVPLFDYLRFLISYGTIKPDR